MKKWKCMNRECGENCIIESKKFHPANCPMFTENFHLQADWREVTEPVTESNQLPKLTAEVFDRPDCPVRAKYAAVDPCGDAYFYIEKPQASSNHWCVPVGCEFFYINRFDPTDWQNSLIKRPAKLPDWCKVDDMGWHKRAGYFKVTYVDVVDNRVDIQQIDDKSRGYFSFNTICNDVKQARLRPYNAEEMRGLVGRVVDKKDGDAFVVAAYTPKLDSRELSAVCIDDMWVTPDAVLEYFTLDGKTCGVLEHLEDGEWVE